MIMMIRLSILSVVQCIEKKQSPVVTHELARLGRVAKPHGILVVDQ